MESNSIINWSVALIDVRPLTLLTGNQWDECFVPPLGVIAPVLHVDIKPSISLIEVDSAKADSKHEFVGANCIVCRVNFLEICEFGVDIDFVEGVDGGAGEDGNEDNDNYN